MLATALVVSMPVISYAYQGCIWWYCVEFPDSPFECGNFFDEVFMWLLGVTGICH